MGYSTYFEGQFKLNNKLDDKTYEFLQALGSTRRMKRDVDPKYGVEGEFYVEGGGMGGQNKEDNVINYNQPPKTQPSLWCDWVPTPDRMYIEWNKGEKFYGYIEWIKYIIVKILAPKGYILNGKVTYQGEDIHDNGVIQITNNIVTNI